MVEKRLALVALLPVLLLISGCFVEDDTITITNDGVVRFESVVTVADPDKKIEFADLERLSFKSVDELKRGNWTVQQKTLSRTRPYKIRFTGSGTLDKIVPQTKFYALQKVNDKQYEVTFLAPGAENKNSKRSLVFVQGSDQNAKVYGPDGSPVTQIDSVSPNTIYTIKLK